ncbi:S8 family serine peptidase [Actinokineospora auranticolor]|uniref:Subtilisin family serine protease n=1 Tax=Actinokineospora auranticolor TaxID=155976 RepID=A0A2S6GHP0_9PSEU|nr:S8 family serine peptidase [Actinokineospora auranticolor]PPK64681.1 subtilisin family serine protease [Actinokineospora auranticolor]
MPRRTTAAVSTAAMILGSLAATTAAAEPAPTTTTQTAHRSLVTLVTGDQVVVPPKGRRPLFLPAKGREHVDHLTSSANGHTLVIPIDALPLLRSGALDQRLFDVDTLAESGYDERRADLPLIQTGPSTRAAGVRETRDLTTVDARALSADKAALPTSWRNLVAPGGKLWLDTKRTPDLDRSTAQIGAPAAWQAGLTGAGIKVAVVDTGVDETHPDLAGREIAQANFTDEDQVDRVGHGTHVASIIAGGGAKYRGVANGAKILDAKVLGPIGGSDSSVLAGIEWAVAQGADIINMSLGATDTPGLDVLEEAVERLSAEKGVLFVVSAGNSGPTAHAIGSPGSAPSALTVGSVDRDDSVSRFSSRGPGPDGSIKPEITAPGAGIVAAKAAQGRIGDQVEPGYVALSGTSMAAPHVAGAAALLAQAHPDWTGAQLKAVLTASAKPNPTAGPFDQGAGRVDVTKALTQTLTTTPSAVSLGTQLWPHNDDTPVTKELAYRNGSAADVTLDLGLDVKGPDGKPAPADLFALSADKVTVPAGGTASVRITADTRIGTADGLFSGVVTATASGQALRTPVAVERESESYDLTLRYRDATGAADDNWLTTAINPVTWYTAQVYADETGVARLRVPKGEYFLTHVNFAADGTQQVAKAVITAPTVAVTRATTQEVDVRKNAGPIEVRTPDPAVPLGYASISFVSRAPGGGGFGTGIGKDDLSSLRIGQIGPRVSAERLTWSLLTAHTDATHSWYSAFFREGEVPRGFRGTVRAEDQATIKTTIGKSLPGSRVIRELSASTRPDDPGFGISHAVEGTEFTDQVTTGGARWTSNNLVVDGQSRLNQFYGSQFVPKKGRTYRERANVAVFGPGFGAQFEPWFARRDGSLVVATPLFNDGADNVAFVETTSAKVTLYQGDRELGSGGDLVESVLPIGNAAGEFRLTATATRAPEFEVSTRVSAEWTFTSRPGADQEPIKLAAVRFKPNLNADNAAPTGKFTVPVALQLEDGSHGKARRLDVEVSYDEGKTWQRARVHNKSEVLLDHPKGATSVSLRATAEDARGGTVQQTIIKAYLLTKR